MKKLSIMLAAFAAVMSFSSCETSHDDNPVLPDFKDGMTADFLNEPVMQQQYINITEAESTGSLQLTCSQPTEYGYAASVRYTPQISLTENFTDFRQYDADWTASCKNLHITNSNIAEGVAEMLNLKEAGELPEGYYPLYVRFRADLYTDQGSLIPGHTIYSNVVKFDHIHVDYLAIWVAGVPQDLYMIGSFNGWAQADPALRFVTGPNKNTWVTEQSFTINKGETFKVTPAQWNAPFNGAAFNAGSNGNVMKIDEEYELYVDSGSSDITMDADFTGKARLTYKDGKYLIIFIPD